MGWGDEIMASGQARQMHERTGRPVKVLDRAGRPRWHAAWENNPRIVHPRRGKLFTRLVNGPGARPYIAAKTEERWIWQDWPEGGPPPGELYFSQEEMEFGRRHVGRIVLEPTIKACASPNKAWGWMRWGKLAWVLQEKYGQRLTQFSETAEGEALDGVELIVTPSFRYAAAVLLNARAAVLPEGGLHHAAAAVGLSAVVLFGGFIAPRHTGYAGHVNVFTGGEACGMRVSCEHCGRAMAAIQPEAVAEQLMEVLRERVARPVAT